MAEQMRVPVSAYQRTRMQTVRMGRGERRRLVIDFNAAMDADRSIVSATFRTSFPNFAAMSAAEIDGRAVSVLVDGQHASVTPIRCDVTLDDGAVISQFVMVAIALCEWFEGEVAPTQGPRTLTVTA